MPDLNIAPDKADRWTDCTPQEDFDLTFPAFVGTIFLMLAVMNVQALWALIRGLL